MAKIIVAGSRDFRNYDLLKYKLDLYLKNLSDITIISGNALGADQLGEKYANENGFKKIICCPIWTLYNKKAGYLRNLDMASIATHTVLF